MNFYSLIAVVVFAYLKMLISSTNVCYILWSQELNRKLYRLCQMLKVSWNTLKKWKKATFFSFRLFRFVLHFRWDIIFGNTSVVDDTMACISFPQFKVYAYAMSISLHIPWIQMRKLFLLLFFLISYIREHQSCLRSAYFNSFVSNEHSLRHIERYCRLKMSLSRLKSNKMHRITSYWTKRDRQSLDIHGSVYVLYN